MSVRRRDLAVAALLLALFALDAWWALSGASDRVDHFALVWLRDPAEARNLRVPHWTLGAAIAITDAGGFAIRLPAVIAGVAGLALAGRRRWALAFALAVTSAFLALPLIKIQFGRARPDLVWQLVHETRQSFPSGHAFGSAVTYPLLGLWTGAILRRRWLVWAGAALSLAIGLSRVFLGVHWLSDVIGGWLLGAAWVMATLAAVGREDGPAAERVR